MERNKPYYNLNKPYMEVEPRPNNMGQKVRHLECMLGPSRWLHEISLPKRVDHHFWPGLIPNAKNTVPIESGKMVMKP